MDGGGAEADEAGDVVGRPGLRSLGDDGGVEAHAGGDEVVVDGADGDEHRDEGVLGSDAALLVVGEHEHLGAAAHGGLSLGAERGHGGLQPLRARGDGVERGEEGGGLGGLDRLELGRVEHGRLDAQLVGELWRGRISEIPPDAERHVDTHDDALAQRVDGRVGHLREALLEVVVDGVRLLREYGERRVLAEREERLLARVGHVANLHLEVLERPAEGGELLDHVAGHLASHLGVEGPRLDHGAPLLEPLGVGRLAREIELDAKVLLEISRLEVERDHVARAEPPLAHHVLVVNLDDAGLRHEADEAILGLQEAGGTQAVAVERRAELFAVAEDEERRPVPRLLQTGVVLVHGDDLRVRLVGRLVAVGFGHEDGERLRGRLARAAHGVLEDGVEVGRVGLGVRAERVAPVAPDVEGALPVDVAGEGVDLAVVREETHGLGQRPLGDGIGGEAAVVDREVGLK
mmetsp:Transcript_41077/g.87663  ORF Transcript_41077/g.87663 Transcript_41077/m.87663 type:complete len:462 (-) Transcript_41077:868-2253(-)